MLYTEHSTESAVMLCIRSNAVQRMMLRDAGKAAAGARMDVQAAMSPAQRGEWPSSQCHAQL